MSFNILEFTKVNRGILIWAAFIALIYILRQVFALIFITFVLCFITHGLSAKFHRLFKQRRRFLVVCIYLVLVFFLMGLLVLGLPKIISEARAFTETLPRSLALIDNQLPEFAKSNPTLQSSIDRLQDVLTLDTFISTGWGYARQGLEKAWHFFTLLIMGLLFSFLIMMDLPNLIRKVRALRYTKAAPVYEAMASSVVLFAQVVGENFRAQIIISFCNTVLTTIGLSIIGTGSIALLSVVVFSCGLIPVLGVFLSSVPIILVAINEGGLHMMAYVLILILIIHALEAYVLNPRIVSAAMHINPVITLMILYFAHTFMGMWGVILGVPISVYFFRQISGNGHKSKNGSRGEKPDDGAPPPSATDLDAASV
jgi:predicted PurR-regulated permease PerM